MLATFLSQVVNGLILGSLIGLIALGYTMVYGIIQLINFAHGEVFMVGAYGGLFMFTYLLPTCVQQQWYLALPLLLIAGAAVSTAGGGAHGAVRLPAVARCPPARPADHRAGRVGGAAGAGPQLLPGRDGRAAVPEGVRHGHVGDPGAGGRVPLRWTGC